MYTSWPYIYFGPSLLQSGTSLKAQLLSLHFIILLDHSLTTTQQHPFTFYLTSTQVDLEGTTHTVHLLLTSSIQSIRLGCQL